MYLKHFRLKCMPFEIGPDPKFLWLGSKHEEAFSILRYGIMENKGFVVITGEPGTGKSTLLNATIAAFDKNVRFAKISDPALNVMDFFNFAADAFQMGRSFRSKGEFLIELKRFIRAAGPQKLILVIDEAQRLTAEMLEQIRVFTDAERTEQNVFSCILAGQPEFLDMVRKNRALAQRIFFSHSLQPLTREETAEYLAHRLKLAGRSKPLFTPASVIEIFRLSEGNPRLINILCDQALVAAYGSGKEEIGPELIREGTESTLIQFEKPVPPVPPAPAPEPAPEELPAPDVASIASSTPQRRWSRAYLPALAVLAVLILAAFLYRGGGFKKSQTADAGAANAQITDLQQQLADAQNKSAAAEAQLSQSRAAAAAYEKELKELRGTRELAAEREAALAARDATITDLRRKLEARGTETATGSKQIDLLQAENSRLQAQLAEAARQKSAIESRSNQDQKIAAAASADARASGERILQLESAVSERDRKLAALEQRVADLQKAATSEASTREQLKTELSARQALIADLQKRFESARALQQKAEADLISVRAENARLQDNQRGKPQPTATSVAAQPQVPPKTVSEPNTAESPDPARAIDFLIKRKAQ